MMHSDRKALSLLVTAYCEKRIRSEFKAAYHTKFELD